MKPLISICIPLFNKCAQLERCFEHILNQSCGDFEVVVVNNASTDGPEAILEAWSKQLPLRVITLPVTLSIHESWLFTLGCGRGAIRQLHSADDYLVDGILQRVSEAFRTEPSLDYLVGRTLSIMDDGSLPRDQAVLDYHRRLEEWRGVIRPELTLRQKADFLALMGPGQNFFGDINPCFMREHCVDFLREAARTTAPLFHTVPDLEIYLKLFVKFRGRYFPEDTVYCTINESSTYAKTRKNQELALISYEIPALTALPFLAMHPVFREVNREISWVVWLRRIWRGAKAMVRNLWRIKKGDWLSPDGGS